MQLHYSLESRSDTYGDQLLEHVAHPQYDIPHETSYEVPHEIKESVELTDDWLNLIEHNEGAYHISDELRKNQFLQGGSKMPVYDGHHNQKLRKQKLGPGHHCGPGCHSKISPHQSLMRRSLKLSHLGKGQSHHIISRHPRPAH